MHVAIIMDGNGRWAKAREKPRHYGHQAGARTLKKIIAASPDLGIGFLTVYAFSSENWQRSVVEVSGLMGLFQTYLMNTVNELNEKNVRLLVIGDRTILKPSLCRAIEYVEKSTASNQGLIVQLAINYGGHLEIVHAMKKIAHAVAQKILLPDEINAAHITQALWTYPFPDPDLLIRTGGEMRLSNYLLWQLRYSELLFVSQLWPDFTPEDLSQALCAYHKRHRRFGNVIE